MSSQKKFKLSKDQIIDLAKGYGGCIATDRITVEGMLVDYMYRQPPANEMDSGWRFYSGTEDQAYIDDLNNSSVYDVNTIANYDRAIIPYLDYPIGSELERVRGTDKFQLIPG